MEPLFLFIFCGRDFFAEFIFSKRCEKNTGKTNCFVEKNDDLKILSDTFDPEEYAICIAKGNSDLTDKFNSAIEELQKDGTIDSITSNYIGDEAGKHPYETPDGTEYPNGTLTMAIL